MRTSHLTTLYNHLSLSLSLCLSFSLSLSVFLSLSLYPVILDGEVYTRFFIRSCGYEMDKCLDDQDLQPFIGEYEKDINADVENGTFLGFKGTVCFCTGPACNTGNTLSPSPVPLIAVGVVLLLCQAITWRP